MKGFIAYRRAIDEQTHSPHQRNAPSAPQYEGVIFTDGTVAIRWLTACRSTSIFNSLREMLLIHGHPEYGTEIFWDDSVTPQEWIDMLEGKLQ